MKKKVVSAILIIILLLCAGCSAKQGKAVANEDEFVIPVNTDDGYEYTVYGRVVSSQRINGSEHGVVAIEPLYEGGTDYAGYEWLDCYVSAEVFDRIEEADYNLMDDQRAIKATIRNSADGGGFISLPAVLMDYEEIDSKDIPVWGGA